jgi:hypothetical protein
MIIDEADLSLAHTITLDKDACLLNGLVHLKDAKKAIYLSATMPPYFRNLIGHCFGEYDYVEFTSQY